MNRISKVTDKKRNGLGEAPRSTVSWTPEHRLFHAMDRIVHGFCLIDGQGVIMFANAMFRGLFARTRNEVRSGVTLRSVLLNAIEKGDIKGSPLDVDSWLRARNPLRPAEHVFTFQDDRFVRAASQQTFDGGSVITFTDITEFKRREVWLTELHDRLAGEGEDLKLFARHLAVARAEATDALHKAEAANAALAREIAERRALERELRRMANTDPLTGVLNRRRFIELSEREIERARRYGRPVSALMLDLDHFKRINDNHGHTAGDLALGAFARCCAEQLREPDLFSRFGGEEFAALMPETPLESALQVAERLRAATDALMVDIGGSHVTLSVSIGVATLGEDDNLPLAILTRADQALYAAKEAGRNRVAYVDEDGSHAFPVPEAQPAVASASL